MTDTLFLREVKDGFEWIAFDGQGQMLFQGSGGESALFDKLAEKQFNGSAIGVTPGDEVLMTRAGVPSRQYRQIVQAVPYVVEEQLAADVEDCFFALGDRDSGGQVNVAVVAVDKMLSWASRASDLDLDVHALIPECSLVEDVAGVSSIIDGDRVHIAGAEGQATLPVGELPLAVSLMANAENIQIWVPAGDEASVELQVRELETTEAAVELVSSNETAFERLCRGYSGDEINLLQGPYKVVEKRSESAVIWRSVAILAVCAVLLNVGSKLAEGWYLASRAEQFEEETIAIYKKTFPGDRNVRDIRRRWNAHLGRQESAGNVFIRLFSRSSQGLTAAGLQLTNVNFNESRGDLVLQIQGGQSEALVQYAQQLNSEGLNAEIGTITQEDGGVRGSIRVKEGNAS